MNVVLYGESFLSLREACCIFGSVSTLATFLTSHTVQFRVPLQESYMMFVSVSYSNNFQEYSTDTLLLAFPKENISFSKVASPFVSDNGETIVTIYGNFFPLWNHNVTFFVQLTSVTYRTTNYKLIPTQLLGEYQCTFVTPKRWFLGNDHRA